MYNTGSNNVYGSVDILLLCPPAEHSLKAPKKAQLSALVVLAPSFPSSLSHRPRHSNLFQFYIQKSFCRSNNIHAKTMNFVDRTEQYYTETASAVENV